MRKEVKLNLLFFGVLAVLMAPGFVILMNKKLGGSADPNYLPHDVPMSVAYNQPPPVPPRLPRVEPSEARHWVTQLMQDRVGRNALLARSEGGASPVMGDRFVTQLLTVTRSDAEWTACVLLWTDRGDVASNNPRLTLNTPAGQGVVEGAAAERLSVPKTVRHALQKVGYVNPPESVWLLTGKAAVEGTPTSLKVNFNGQSTIETVSVPEPKSPTTAPSP